MNDQANMNMDAGPKAGKPEKKLPASICPDPGWPFGERTEECDPFDSMPLRERNRAGLPLRASQVDFLGKALWVSFAVVALSGIALLAGYRPTVDSSFSSTEYIQESFFGGWWIRGIHKYGTDLFVLLAGLRLLRLAYRRAYRKPGELGWIVAIATLLFGMISGLTGYLLVWNQKAFWTGRVLADMSGPGSVQPLGGLGLGGWLSDVFAGADGMSQSTLSAIFAVHIALSILFLLFAMRWRLAARMQAPRHRSFTPELSSRLILSILAALTLIALIFPPPLGSPLDKGFSPHPIAADWYMLAIYQIVQSMSPGASIAIFVLGLAILILLPWLDRSGTSGPRPMITALIIAALLSWFVLTVAAASQIWTAGWTLGLAAMLWLFAIAAGLWDESRPPSERERRPGSEVKRS